MLCYLDFYHVFLGAANLSFFSSFFSPQNINSPDNFYCSFLWIQWFVPLIFLFIGFYKRCDLKFTRFLFMTWLIILFIFFSYYLAGSGLPLETLGDTLKTDQVSPSLLYLFLAQLFSLLIIFFSFLFIFFWLDVLSQLLPGKTINVQHFYLFFFLFSAWVVTIIFLFHCMNYIVLFLLLELQTILTFFLLSFSLEKKNIGQMAVYVIVNSLGTIFYLLSFLIFWQIFDAYTFVNLNMKLLGESAHNWGSLKSLGFFFLFISLFIKSGTAPFQGWLPLVYGKISNFFFSTFMVLPKLVFTAIFYQQLLVFFPISGDIKFSLLFLGSLNIFVGLMSSIGEKYSLRRLLIFSSLTHLGVVLLVLSLYTKMSLYLALVYLIFYLVTFFVFSYLLLGTSSMNGVLAFQPLGLGSLADWKKMVLGFCIGNLSGLPPFPIFFLKLYVIQSLVHEGFLIWATIVLVALIGSMYYYFDLAKKMFFLQDHLEWLVIPLVRKNYKILKILKGSNTNAYYLVIVGIFTIFSFLGITLLSYLVITLNFNLFLGGVILC